jgi:cyclophilin family peptidyl-prolyl cis-trans isomerase
MKKSLLFIALLSATLLMSCGEQVDVVTIKTSYGDMVAILYDETPKHKENFLKLVDQKFYDSLLFHRVSDGFMIQGGDPDSKKATPGQLLGQGGPGYTIPAEINPKFFHDKGALAAARLGDEQNPNKESSGSQFYIVQGRVIPEDEQKIDEQQIQMGLQQMYQSGQYQPYFDSLQMFLSNRDMEGYQKKILGSRALIEKATGVKTTKDVPEEKLKMYSTVGGVPFLDDNYTVFGHVVSGLDVIDKIAAVQKDQGWRPLDDIRMTVTKSKMSKSKIEKEFGYKFPEATK